MSMRHILLIGSLSVTLVATARVHAQVTGYTEEAAFLNALSQQGFTPVYEGFEDDAAWGAVRSSIVGGSHTAPSVHNLGITWVSSSPNNEVTTSDGAARSGNWGFYSLPHGDYANGIGDGWRGTGDQQLVAVGGWVRTNTPPAKIGLFLDGDELNPVDFGGADALTGGYLFFGVIAPGGFSMFDYRELEGVLMDQKFIFSDDFIFAFSGVITDCNENGVADGIDINTSTSSDCNRNLIPDECEIDINSPAPGGPFYCTNNCGADCNDDGMLDECEVVTAELYSSGQLTPIGAGSPQSFTIPNAPTTYADVVLEFTAYANLGGAPDHISVDVNGVAVGTVFGPDGSDCPDPTPDATQLSVPAAVFNDAVAGGDAVIGLVTTAEVDPLGCDLPTYVTVDAQLFVPSAADGNANGIPDECEIGVEPIPTVSEWGMAAMVLLVLSIATLTFRRGRVNPCPVRFGQGG